MLSAVVVTAAVVVCAFGLSYWAYRARRDRSAFVGLYLLFGFPAVLFLIAGAAVLVAGDGQLGGLLLLAGLGFGLPLLPPFRRLVAAVTPMDPASPVDMTGLCLLLAALAVLASASAAAGAGEPPEDLPSIGLVELVLQAVLLVVLGYAAVGWWFVRSLREATARLGIVRPTWQRLGAALGFLALAFAVLGGGGAIAQAIQPEVGSEVSQVTEEITAEVQNPVGALVLGASAGIGEEALFRGAIQPRYGIVLTSIVFALIHGPQYGFNLTIAVLFAISVLFGLERRWFGTTASMATHALFNAVQVLILATF